MCREEKFMLYIILLFVFVVTFFRYNRDTKFERGTKHWQKEWQVSIKKDVLPAEYVKILVRWQLSKFTMDVMLW